MGCGSSSTGIKDEKSDKNRYKTQKSKNLIFDNYKYNLMSAGKDPNAQDFILDDSNQINNYQNNNNNNGSNSDSNNNRKGKESECLITNKNLIFLKKLNSENNFFIKQYVIGCLSQYSYYIESGHQCAIIDPMRDVDFYLDFIKQRGTKLMYVIETHFHADFVSGHIELAKMTGCKIVFGPTAAEKSKYEIYEMKDNEDIVLGFCKIKAIHTPGHTLESSCFLLHNEDGTPKALFTGDTIFLGEVGRPDLAINLIHKKSTTNLAEQLYYSIQKIKKYDENIIILPGHGPGSLCGKKIDTGFCDTLKNQLTVNKAFSNQISKEEFIENVLKELPNPPAYYTNSMSLNINGHKNLYDIIAESMNCLTPEEFVKLASNSKVAIIDTRNQMNASEGIIRGSVLIPLKITYAVWTATLFNSNTKFLIVCDEGKEKESIVRLARVGYHNILGYLGISINEFKLYDNSIIINIPIKTEKEAEKLIINNEVEIIDVREITEVINTGCIYHAEVYSLSNILNYLNEFAKFKKPIGLYCRSGSRATVAASILIRYNFNNVMILGGFEQLKNTGVKIVEYKK